MNVLQSRAFLALLVWVLWPSCSGAATLGRLFFTPQDRVYLEQLRWASPESLSAIPEQHPENMAASSGAKSAFVTLGGTVTRSNGAQVVWLNGVSYNKSAFPANVRVHQPFTAGQIELRVEEKGKLYPLRPGQTLDIGSKQVHESYERPAAVAAPPETTSGQESGLKQSPAVEGALPVPAPVPGAAPLSPIK